MVEMNNKKGMVRKLQKRITMKNIKSETIEISKYIHKKGAKYKNKKSRNFYLSMERMNSKKGMTAKLMQQH